MNRSILLNKIYDQTPGIYLHIPFKALGWMIAFILIIALLCIQSVRIQINPGPAEYPMFIEAKKIVFMCREPKSIAEARDILRRFDRNIVAGTRVLVPECEDQDD